VGGGAEEGVLQGRPEAKASGYEAPVPSGVELRSTEGQMRGSLHCALRASVEMTAPLLSCDGAPVEMTATLGGAWQKAVERGSGGGGGEGLPGGGGGDEAGEEGAGGGVGGVGALGVPLDAD